ncbi:hypothetical protein CI610_00557 [invertebrate metagenome]|uniref:Uncharacterized protein n=1 Tax=invertebrate metagenome TaxID=1711999 RepID=A0A2H9TB95_9ZZZZ
MLKKNLALLALLIIPALSFSSPETIKITVKDDYFQKVRLIASHEKDTDHYSVKLKDKFAAKEKKKEKKKKPEITFSSKSTLSKEHIFNEEWQQEMIAIIKSHQTLLFNQSGNSNGLNKSQLQEYNGFSMPFVTFPDIEYVNPNSHPVAFRHEGNDRYLIVYHRERAMDDQKPDQEPVHEYCHIHFYMGCSTEGEEQTYSFIHDNKKKPFKMVMKNSVKGEPLLKTLTVQ